MAANLERRAAEDEFDISSVLADVGRCCYGVSVVEMWTTNKTRTHLVRPDGGSWVAEDCGLKLEHRFNSSCLDYSRVAIGEQRFPYFLWSKVGQTPGLTTPSEPQSSSNDRLSSSSSSVSWNVPPGDVAGIPPSSATDWVDIIALAEDTDPTLDPQLHHLAGAGLRWATGVHFRTPSGMHGFMIVLAHEQQYLAQLQSYVRKDYLLAAAHVAGAMYELQEPRNGTLRRMITIEDAAPRTTTTLSVTKEEKTEEVETEETIFERIGGRRLIGVCVEELYKRILRDENLIPFFAGVNVHRMKQHMAHFLSMVFSERGKTDKRYVESVRLIHAHMAVTENHFELVCFHLVGALKEMHVKEELIEDITTGMTAFRQAFASKSSLSKHADNRSILEKLGGMKALDLCVEEGLYLPFLFTQ